MTHPNADDFFGGGGAPSAKLEKPGDSVEGTIVHRDVVQQREYAIGAPGPLLYWDANNKPSKDATGRPMYQLNVTLQTTLRDPSIEDDDGRRRVYIKGRRLTTEVRRAFTAAGAPGLEDGGWYRQQMTGYDPESANPSNPAKLYAVQYRRPVVGAEVFGVPAAVQDASTQVHDPSDPASAAFVTARPAPAPVPAAAPAAAAPAAAPIDKSALQAALAAMPPEVRAALLAQQNA